MFRYLVAHLPCFRLERCGWSSSELVALVAEEKSALRVQATTPSGHQRGIRVGMTAAEARARVPELQTEALDAESEQTDLNEVTGQLLRVSPNLGALPPDSMVAEISRSTRAASLALGGRRGAGPGGCEHLAGAERALMERVRLRLEDLGHLVRVVVADDLHTALAVARWGGHSTRVPPGEAAEALAGLPLMSLELPPKEHELLEGLGIHTVGAFAALDAASVAGRLGPVAVAAHAMASGRAQADPLPLWDESGPLALHQDLPDPVTELEALLFVINAQLRTSALELTAAGRAATRLTLRFAVDGDVEAAPLESEVVLLEEEEPRRSRSPAPPPPRVSSGWQDLSVRLGRPTRDPLRMLALLRLRLERLQLAGPVTAVALEITETALFTGRQRDLEGQERTREALAEVAGRLQDTLGSHAVLSPRLLDRHRPEQAWEPQPFAADDRSLSGDEARRGRRPRQPSAQVGLFVGSRAVSAIAPALARDPVQEQQGFPEAEPPSRPPILLVEPHALEVEPARSPESPPLSLRLDGRWRGVEQARGPERVLGEWWDRGGFQRIYWRLQLQGGRTAWVYQEDGRWMLHGWWDR